MLWAHLHDPPPAPAGLEEVMAKALAKEPGDRYATCSELAEAAREGLGLGARRDRRPLVVAALGVLVAAGALAAGLVLTLDNSGAPKPDLTVRNNSLVRVDAEDTEISGVTPVGQGPQSAAGGDAAVWTYNWDDRTVSQIDAATGAIQRSVSVSGSPPFVPGNSLAADATGAWVISSADGRGLTQSNPACARRSFLLTATRGGGLWRGFSLGRDEGRGINTVLRVDPQTGAVSAAVAPGRGPDVELTQCQHPGGGALAVGEGAVWDHRRYGG